MPVLVCHPRRVLCGRLEQVSRAGGRGSEEGERTALYADWGEAEVALVGEVAVAGVAPCCGEDEVDHGGGEGGAGGRMAGL